MNFVSHSKKFDVCTLSGTADVQPLLLHLQPGIKSNFRCYVIDSLQNIALQILQVLHRCPIHLVLHKPHSKISRGVRPGERRGQASGSKRIDFFRLLAKVLRIHSTVSSDTFLLSRLQRMERTLLFSCNCVSP